MHRLRHDTSGASTAGQHSWKRMPLDESLIICTIYEVSPSSRNVAGPCVTPNLPSRLVAGREAFSRHPMNHRGLKIDGCIRFRFWSPTCVRPRRRPSCRDGAFQVKRMSIYVQTKMTRTRITTPNVKHVVPRDLDDTLPRCRLDVCVDDKLAVEGHTSALELPLIVTHSVNALSS